MQAGYLSLIELRETSALVVIPNKELVYVWKRFVLDVLNINEKHIRTMFDNVDNEVIFSQDLEYFLTDRLSVYDLAKHTGENAEMAHEKAYHLYLLGMLSAFEDMRCHFPLSMNRKDKCGREAAFCKAKSSDKEE